MVNTGYAMPMPSPKQTTAAGSKPVAVEGLNEHTGNWEPAVAGQRYGAFQVGVQLANRTGALNEIEYSEFVVKAQAFADAEDIVLGTALKGFATSQAAFVTVIVGYYAAHAFL